MKLSECKKYLPIVEAAANGATIQFRWNNVTRWQDWDEAKNGNFLSDEDSENGIQYRVKPEPKLRPWNPEEVPVGALIRRLVRSNESGASAILARGDKGVSVVSFDKIIVVSLDEVFSSCEHSTDNGKTWLPCGVEESN